MAQVVASGKSQQVEDERQGRDLSNVYYPVADAKGKCIAIAVFALDISERRQAETKLVESEAHLRAIVQNEPECIKIIDAQGRLMQMNPAGLRMVEADFAGAGKRPPVLDIVAPEYRSAFAELHKRVIAGEPMQMESR